MKSLEGLTRSQISAIANTPTPQPAKGRWLLMGPDGSIYEAASPMLCIQLESKHRIPALVALARVERSLWNDEEPARLPLTDEQAELCRQWFDQVQDTNPAYLNSQDYALAKLLYEQCDMRVPSSILEELTK